MGRFSTDHNTVPDQTHRPAKALIAIWLVIIAFAAFLITGLIASLRSAEQRVRDQALSYARVVEQHASAAFDRANIGLGSCIDHLQPGELARGRRLSDKRRKQIENLLMSHQLRTAGIVAMTLADAEGNVIAHSLGTPLNASVEDRHYFQALKRPSSRTVVISEVLYGRTSNIWGIQVARRINFPDGSFGGIIVASLGLAETFTNFFSTLSLGKDGLIAINDREGGLLVRYPVIEGQLAQQGTAPGSGAQIPSGEFEGVAIVRSHPDDIERVLGFRHLQRFPVFVTVGYSREDALSVWRMERTAVTVAIVLAIFAGAYITFAMQRTQRTEEALRVALEDQATHDLLTGLPNRRFAYAWLPYALSSARRENLKVAVLFVDLDRFKEVNDRWGHEAGDLALKTVTERFISTVRGSDALVRFGGDEFLVLVRSVESREELTSLASRLIASLEPAISASGHDFQLGASIGIAVYPDDADGADGLIAAADNAMYQAKRLGGNRHWVAGTKS